MATDKGVYVPKKGDIIDYNGTILEVVGYFEHTNYLEGITLHSGIELGFYYKPEFKLVGLSLERIKERDEKLIITLKEQFYDLYHQIGKVEVWREGGSDVFCDLVEEYINKSIDKVFAEVDKQ